jgi:crotonobetaine/carnitine-CoA ligase
MSPSGRKPILSTVALPPVHPYLGLDLISCLERRAAVRGRHPFLVWEPFEGARRAWTYEEFLSDVQSMAAGLAARGIGEGSVVLNHVGNTPAFLVTLFACAHLGALSVNVNTRYSDDELQHAIDLTGAAGMVTDPSLGLASGSAQSSLKWVAETDPATGMVPELDYAVAGAPRCAIDAGRPLCVQLTSGTTSRPKAVVYTHANALWGGQIGSRHWHLQPDTVMLVFAPLFHTMALAWQLLPTLWEGGTVILQPKFSSSRFWEVVERNACTHTTILGPTLQLFEHGQIPPHTLRSLTFGFELPELAERLGVSLFSTYGMTELITQPVHGDIRIPDGFGVTGRPAAEYELRIVDEGGADVNVRGTGELRVRGIRGLSLFAEYLNDPEATTDSFDETGYFKTGDLVTLRDGGGISFTSRLKDMLKVSGENVAAAEIERVVGGVAGVREVAVVGVADAQHGEVPFAFVVAAETSDDREALRVAITAACTEKLADFKRPRQVRWIEELPRATLDKIDKGTLRSLAAEPLPAAGPTP